MSKRLIQRIDERLPTILNNQLVEELNQRLHIAHSLDRFDSRREFQGYLSEGILLNVNKLSADSLAIPAGQYMVLVAGDKNSVLVPLAETHEVLENLRDQYEVTTSSLLNSWDTVTKVLLERMTQPMPQQAPPQNNQKPTGKFPTPEKLDDSTDLSELFDQIPRSNADIAKDIGVATPSVGRWTAPKGSGSQRTPTVDHILKISDYTGVGECSILDMVVNNISGGKKERDKNSKSGSGGGAAWGGE